MIPLTEGALDKIVNGVEIDKPILQLLGYKKLGGTSNAGRYRLLVSDGRRINSFTMLSTQLNHMIDDDLLTEFSVCQVNRYALSLVNNSGKQKRVMVILDLEVKVPGAEVKEKIGNPSYASDNTDSENDNQPAQLAAPPPVQRSNTNTVQKTNMGNSMSSDISTTPIVAISPYNNKWVIKARVTSKSQIRTWSNSRGEGKLFSMDLADETGEIRCTAFRDQCDKFYDMIEAGKVYYISRCVVKPANKQFNSLKNDYEMSMTNDTEIVLCITDTDSIPKLQFDFQPIKEIENKAKNDMIDVLGIVQSCSDVITLTARSTGRELRKRDVNLIDQSCAMVTLSLWGKEAEDFDGSNNPIVAIKAARIGEFNGGKNLSTFSSTVMQIEPDLPEAHALRGWYTASNHDNITSLSKTGGGRIGDNSPWYTFMEATAMQLGRKSAPDFYTAKATVNIIRAENAIYKSCPSEGCKKKLIDQDNEMYRCEKCNREYPNFKYRLLASMNIADWTDNRWVTAFNDDAEKVIGCTAQELGELHACNKDAFLEKVSEATFSSFLFKLRAKMETFSDEERIKTVCTEVIPMDYKVYNNYLINEIKKLTGIQEI